MADGSQVICVTTNPTVISGILTGFPFDMENNFRLAVIVLFTKLIRVLGSNHS